MKSKFKEFLRANLVCVSKLLQAKVLFLLANVQLTTVSAEPCGYNCGYPSFSLTEVDTHLPLGVARTLLLCCSTMLTAFGMIIIVGKHWLACRAATASLLLESLSLLCGS